MAIDWAATAARFGYANAGELTGKRPRVVCRCDLCLKARPITIRVKSRIDSTGQLPWTCPACVGRARGPEIAAQLTRQWADCQYRADRSESSRHSWSSPAYRQAHAAAVAAGMKSVDMSGVLRRRYSDPAERHKHRLKSLELWADDNFRARVAAGRQASDRVRQAPSSLHLVLESMLQELNVAYTAEYALGPYNFDYLVHRSPKPLLLEINGDYWHNLKSSVARDERKAAYAARFADDYDLMVVWEFEFYTKGRVRDRVETALGITPPPVTAPFRLGDVSIRPIDAGPARLFLTQYHYSGSLGRGGQCFGAFLGDELIGVIVYSGVGRKETATRLGLPTSEVAEISRLCIHPNRHLGNFASWFIGRTRKLVARKWLVAFADTTFGHSGVVYRAAGFRLDGEVQPSYWYVDQSGWVMHKKTLYEHARSLRMSESEFATTRGYRKVIGSKKYRYVYRAD